MKKFAPPPAPAPVVVLRPARDGSLVVAEVVQPTEYRRFDNGFSKDREIIRFRLIAIQETGEEMFAGNASSRSQALDKKYAWLDDHPEHRDVIIESI